MKFLDYCSCCCCRHHRRGDSQQRSPSPEGSPHPPPIDDQVMVDSPQAEEPPKEDGSTSTDDPRPILRRMSKFSADGLKNGAVRMKSERQPPSFRDICWMENGEMQETNHKRKYTPAIPPPSWSRFPSHTRAERSFSSAGKEDLVYARDFALEPCEWDLNGGDKEGVGEQGWGKKYRRHTFEKSMAQKWRRYHSSSLRPTKRGFRSSISVGGVLEYPELAILPTLEAVPLVSRAVSSDSVDDPESNLAMSSSSLTSPRDAGPDRAAEDGARLWSQVYQGCLLPRPITSDETSTKDSASGLLRPDNSSRHSRQSSEHRRLSLRSSGEMRSSTLNFQKSLEEYEIRARERALQAASDASLRRPKEVS